MRAVLRDQYLNENFQKNGYVQVPFISKNEVEELKKIFFDTLPESGGQLGSGDEGVAENHLITYDFTFIDKNPEYKRIVYDVITEYFKPHMDRLLSDYKPIIANYIRKKSATGEVPLHQNWAFADEKKCCTVSIWCPLVDSTIENGTLQVVPESHKRFGEIRGPMVPWELENIKKDIIERYLVPLETRAGDCIILDDSIIHYSAVNHTEGLRLAIQLICIPAELDSIHYFMNPSESKTKTDVLSADVEFYMQFNPWKKPEGLNKLKTIEFTPRYIDINEFDHRLKGKRYDTESSDGIISRLKKMFG